jgi:hypothetical protein
MSSAGNREADAVAPSERVGASAQRKLRIAAVLAAVLVGAQVLWLSPQELSRLFPDDAFFYMKTARNVGAGLGSTFDGLNPTNGYHPLYLAVLALASLLAPLEGWDGLYTVAAIDIALSVAWIWIAVRAVQLAGWSNGAVGLLLCALTPLALNGDFGMEVNLLLPLAWSFVFLACRIARRPDTQRGALGAGLVGAAVALTRVDAILFVLCVTAAVVLARRSNHVAQRTHSLRSAVLLAGPALVALALFGALNHATSGHWSTVSGWLKTQSVFELQVGEIAPHRALSLALAVVGAAVAVARALRDRSPNALIAASLGAWVLLYSALLCFAVRGGPETWYFPLPLSIGALVGIEALRSWFATRGAILRQASVAAGVIAALALGAHEVNRCLARGARHDAGIEIAERIRRELPPDAHIFQVDNSGIVGYFCQRALINGDGLINGWEFQEALRTGRLPEYLERNQVEWFVLDELPATLADVHIPVPLWDEPPVSLEFSQPPQEVARCGRFVLLHADPHTTVVRP